MNDLSTFGEPLKLTGVDISHFLRQGEQKQMSGDLPPDSHPLAPSSAATYDDALSDLTELSDTDSEWSDGRGMAPEASSKPSGVEAKSSRKPRKTIRPLPAFSPASRARVVDVPIRLDSAPNGPSLQHPIPHDLHLTSSRSSSSNDLPIQRGQKRRQPKTEEQKAQKKAKKREKRRIERAETRKQNNGLKGVQMKRLKETEVKAAVDFDVGDLPAATGAWNGKNQWFNPKPRTLDDAIRHNIQIISWEGKRSQVIVNCENRAFIAMGAPPRCDDWDELNIRVAGKISAARGKAKFTKDQKHHPCGPSPAMASGYSHGGGTEGPTRCALSQHNQALMDELLGDPDFIRVAGHNNRVFQAINPKLHRLYSDVAEVVLQNDESLKPPFPNSLFAATTVNFGPRWASYDHVDAHNLPHGWCVIDAFGNYNPRKGGHLVLWDLGIAIEFPPGTAIFLPSAILVHSNIQILQGEERYSFTSYSAGGLFRWVYYGLQTEEDLKEEMTQDGDDSEWRKHKVEMRGRWANSLDYFPTWSR